MLLPDQTYETQAHVHVQAHVQAHVPAHVPALPALLRAHRVSPEFFCAYRARHAHRATLQHRSSVSVSEAERDIRRRKSRVRSATTAARTALPHPHSHPHPLPDASSSNEAVHLQRRLLSLSSELVTLRNHLHVGGAGPAAAGAAGAAASGAGAAASGAGAAGAGAPQPAVPPRAPHPHPPPTAQPPAPHHQAHHPLPAPPEPRWRSMPAAGTLAPQPGVAAAATAAAAGGGGCSTVGGGGGGPAAAGDVDDLIHLRGPLTEDAVVRALQARFYQNKYYTMIGPILVAVNAYTDTCNALTLTAAAASQAGGGGGGCGGAGGAATRPELARLVHDAVRHQADSGYPQAIILSGVSGSGKTYASMVLLRRLFDVAGGGPETDAFKHLAAAFTVLRALGTAATPHNTHSSRIGHFIEVQVTDGALYRTKIHCYFLDQTRVVRPPPGERNYHIFYQMLAGLTPDERAQLHLEGYSPQDLRYLPSPPHRRPEPEDAARFHAWKTCLVILGIPFLDVVRVLAAVLLLGNVQFAEGADGAAEPAGEAELAAAAALLGVAAPRLLRGLATRAAPRPPARAARAPATPAAAALARDALAKALYCRTVATIVRRANSLKRLGSTLGTLSSDSNESVHNQDAASASRRAGSAGGRSRAGARSMAALNDAVRHATDGFVGILDMFGFEDAAPSRLEHLCANLCAETMQHFYNTHVFKSSLESCREEGVAGALEVDYVDNVPCIDLVSSLRGGLLAALDAECAAGGSAEQYVARVRAAHRGHARLADARPPHARRFAVRHYAAEVTYDASEFLEANRDAVPDHLLAAFDTTSCEFGFATHLFGAELKVLASAGGPSGGQFRASPTVTVASAMGSAAGAGAAGGGAPGSTLTQDFHTRLDNLLRTLVHARPHFVRCLRANNTETPMLFDRPTIAKQVRALQILETAQLMASGYPHRMRFRAFASRYRALWRRGAGGGGQREERESGGACARVLRAVAAAAAPPAPASPAAVRWALGKRHVFLSEGMRQVLERMRRARRQAAAECIQAAWRRHRSRAPLPLPATGPLQLPTTAPLAAGAGPPAGRPRPAPIAGTPPPDPADKCDPALVKRTCSLFGLDLERPPPLPPPRAYTVSGGVKLGYPQQRTVGADWAEDALRLRRGDYVRVVGAARRGHVAVQVCGRTVCIPHAVLAPARAPAPRPHPPPPPAPPHTLPLPLPLPPHTTADP